MSSISQLPPRARRAAAQQIGARIHRSRLEAGLTQAELGAPYSKSYVSAVEHGRCLPSLPVLWLFAARLGIDVGSLVHGVNPFGTQE